MREVSEAVAALHAGALVVMPTDTVYGLAGRADLTDAVRAIFEVKGRPSDRPLPVLGAGIDDLLSVGVISGAPRRLADAFWPGALTLVVERAPRFTFDLGGDDLSTVAVRVPAHPLALELLGETGPVAVTSANRSGAPPALTIDEAREALGDKVSVYLDGGRLEDGPSTVVRVGEEIEVLRRGAIDEAALHAVLNA